MENNKRKIVIYSTGCPLCRALKTMLDAKKISYSVESDLEKMKEKGYTSVPVLEVDDKHYNYGEAIALIKKEF